MSENEKLLEEMAEAAQLAQILGRYSGESHWPDCLRAALRVFVEKMRVDHHTLTGLVLVHNLMDDGKHEVTCEQLRRVIQANGTLLALMEKDDG